MFSMPAGASELPGAFDPLSDALRIPDAGERRRELERGREAPDGTGLEALQRRDYRELDVSLDIEHGALWCRLAPDGPPSFTPSMLRELASLHEDIAELFRSPSAGQDAPLRYYVQGSTIPGIYNMGGDFEFMKGCILDGDRSALRRYAFDCVESVHRIMTGFNAPVVSIALVEGDALGGGLEGVICCNVIVAERSAKMGLPEVLFNAFPGMGAYSVLSRRLSPRDAERMISSGTIYSAEELHAIGLVDILAENGEGEAAVRNYIAAGPEKHRLRRALLEMRRTANPLALDELYSITEIWVDHMLRISPKDLRRMGHLRAAQARRLGRRGEQA